MNEELKINRICVCVCVNTNVTTKQSDQQTWNQNEQLKFNKAEGFNTQLFLHNIENKTYFSIENFYFYK